MEMPSSSSSVPALEGELRVARANLADAQAKLEEGSVRSTELHGEAERLRRLVKKLECKVASRKALCVFVETSIAWLFPFRMLGWMSKQWNSRRGKKVSWLVESRS
jgi:hypothetical protein